MTWRFSSALGAGRRAKLEVSPPFDVIAQRVVDEMEILCTHTDPCAEAAGFTRIVSCIRVDEELFDLFFNSESGYRGRYFVSPEEGRAANSLLLSLAAESLAHFESHPDMTRMHAEQSLRASSAKCWLAEVGKDFCFSCVGKWTVPQDCTPEILNGRWELGSDPASRSCRKAPFLNQLRILGAFVSETGEEYVAKRKRTRAQQIHEHGWS